jgi:hypothetical protein
MLRHLAIGLVLLGGSPSAMAREGHGVEDSQAQHDKALRLASLLNPADKILEASDRAFRTGIQAALADDKASAAVFDEEPGLLSAIFEAALPILKKHVEASIPSMHREIAHFYAARFTAAELDQLLEFYGTPTGRKIVEGMFAGLLEANFGVAAGPERKFVAGSTLQGAISSASSELWAKLTETDRSEVAKFTRSPVYPKVQAAMPDMINLLERLGNEPTPAMDAEIDETVSRVVEKYMADRAEKSHNIEGPRMEDPMPQRQPPNRTCRGGLEICG